MQIHGYQMAIYLNNYIPMYENPSSAAPVIGALPAPPIMAIDTKIRECCRRSADHIALFMRRNLWVAIRDGRNPA